MKTLTEFINESADAYKAVKKAFPKISNQAVEIIAGWYDNEYAGEDFRNVRDFANFIEDDILDMLEAADGNNDTKLVMDELNKYGYIELAFNELF